MIPFSQAPRPVQLGLERLLAGCHQTPAQIRRAAWFAVGPIAGPGTRAYIFALTEPQWRGSYKTFYLSSVCGAPVNSWFKVWMPLAGGRYRGYRMADSLIEHRGPAFIILTPDETCDLDKMNAGAWWDCDHVLTWDRHRERFRAITSDMLSNVGLAWPAAHGYVGYY